MLGLRPTAPEQQVPLRVVSLLASTTEIVFALGLEHLLVGRSHECDHPAAAHALEAITRPKFPTAGGSRAIDTHIRALVENGLAVYEVDAPALRRLQPDVILTQDQCAVCAVSSADVARATAEWTECESRVVSLAPHTLADVLQSVEKIAEALQATDRGTDLIREMIASLEAVRNRGRQRPAVGDAPRPRIAFIEWIEPLMSGGHWMPELINIAGGESVFGETGRASPWISLEQLVAADPDIIVVAPCGYDLQTTCTHLPEIATTDAWQHLRAVRHKSVFAVDGNALFNRPGPRLVDSAQCLAAIIDAATEGNPLKANSPHCKAVAAITTATSAAAATS